MGKRKVYPGKEIETTLKKVGPALNKATNQRYFLNWGGLLAVARYDGVSPDNDMDFATFYGVDYKIVERCMDAAGYNMTKCMLDDTDESKAVYCSFDKKANSSVLMHICLTFLYPHDGIHYYCHDSRGEISGVGKPSEYFFRGIPSEYVGEPVLFRDAEWPGIPQMTKVRVPRFPGVFLDYCYRDWGYVKQRYNIVNYKYEKDKVEPLNKHGAMSPFAVNVKSMAQWKDERHVRSELKKSRAEWLKELKTTQKQ
jgi:hypothetical protein